MTLTSELAKSRLSLATCLGADCWARHECIDFKGINYSQSVERSDMRIVDRLTGRLAVLVFNHHLTISVGEHDNQRKTKQHSLVIIHSTMFQCATATSHLVWSTALALCVQSNFTGSSRPDCSRVFAVSGPCPTDHLHGTVCRLRYEQSCHIFIRALKTHLFLTARHR